MQFSETEAELLVSLGPIGQLQKQFSEEHEHVNPENLMDDAINTHAHLHKFPDILYHVTAGKNIASIKKHGIKRAAGSRGSYLTDHMPSVISHSDTNPKDAHVVAVKTKGLKLRHDAEYVQGAVPGGKGYNKMLKNKEYPHYAYSRDHIPAHHIHSVVPLHQHLKEHKKEHDQFGGGHDQFGGV